jgi:membrane-associated phospholipid phosphatase
MGRLTEIFIRQRPADVVTIIFLILLIVLTLIYYENLPKAPFLISLYTALIIAQIILIKIKNNGKFLRLFYDLIFPVICIFTIFDSLGWVVHYLNPHDIDPILINIDYFIFNDHPTVILERITNPILTDVLQIAYSTYYFIPISLGIVLLKNRQKESFDKSLFLILFCFYLSYLGYILFPALGPRFTIDHLQNSELRGFIVAEPIQNLLNRLEGIKRDAFPSGHTGIALLVLYLAFKFSRRFFWVLLPVVSSLIFSTIYCRYHYVVDILAGIGLTVITIMPGELLYDRWKKIH